MSMMPLDTELGYAPPMVRHFSIFLDNRVGKLHDLLGGLHEEGAVEVRAISILDSSDYAVIRLLVDLKPKDLRSAKQACLLLNSETVARFTMCASFFSPLNSTFALRIRPCREVQDFRRLC